MWVDPDDGTTWVYNPGDIAWVLASTALVWLMIPGVGFFYSGLLRRKNALSMIWASMMTLAVVSFQVRSFFFARRQLPHQRHRPVVLLGVRNTRLARRGSPIDVLLSPASR